MVWYPGAPIPVAATHFVAVSGLGLDSADYKANDPAVAKKLGIFGYDRATKLEDIKAPGNTIALLMVPPTTKMPWLAGGGSTVRGISDDDKDDDIVQPFVCVKHENKEGTYAIMGDGKVRFIAKNIDPKIFRAMCTINGGEQIADLDKIAPEVPAPNAPAAPPKDAPGGATEKPQLPPTPPVGGLPIPGPPDVPKPPTNGGPVPPTGVVPPAGGPVLPGLPVPPGDVRPDGKGGGIRPPGLPTPPGAVAPQPGGQPQ
jgi:hypothetical protein